jgi:hypothetical protein
VWVGLVLGVVVPGAAVVDAVCDGAPEPLVVDAAQPVNNNASAPIVASAAGGRPDREKADGVVGMQNRLL